MAQLIFHLNSLADPTLIRSHIQIGTAQMLGARFGNEQAWFDAYTQILADWDSYHADLNFSGDEGMADMRESRFRIMRALVRIMGIAEPAQAELHALADEALIQVHAGGKLFFDDSHALLMDLAEKNSLSLVSYFPQKQLEALVKTAKLSAKIQDCIGADTFEQYEMNRRYFEILLIHLKTQAEDCLYIDKQAQVLEAASQVGIKTIEANGNWILALKHLL